jgi:hypothetical protein
LAASLGIFAKVLFGGGDQVLSSTATDLAAEFVYWRQFGFDELRAGHLALWNPHVFSGVPFMGGFQAALFYPPNWIYLILPLRTAINCEIALHVFLFGWFTAIWLKRYRFHPLATLLACIVTMFAGPFFLHVYAGHLATIDALTWLPLILLSLEELLQKPAAKWILVGICALSMQLLAGHPQTLFNTLITCSIYGSIRLWQASHRKQTLLAIALIGIAVIIITTVQLWSGLNASSEGTRQGGVPFSFAAMFSFPPENFLTLLVPGLFGNLTGLSYWGRCYLWEMSAFVGLTGLTMAIFGMTARFPGRAICVSMIGVTAVLALGNHTLLFPLLFRFVPGFDHFRSHSKFLVQALPFVAILTGQGMDRVLHAPNLTRQGAVGALVMALLIGAAGMSLRHYPSAPSIKDRWDHLMNQVGDTGESYVSREHYSDPAYTGRAASFAAAQCLISTAILLAIALLLWLRTYHPAAAFALVALGIGEMFWFANTSITTFSLAQTVPTMIADFIETHPGDYRILQINGGDNSAIAIGADDIWGYDPMVLARYSQLMTYSQDGNPDDASMYVNFTRISRLFRLLRMKYAFVNQVPVYEMKDALPHLLLLSEWARVNDRNEILSSLNSSVFKPDETAILETDPNPAPVQGDSSAGTAQIVQSDPSSMTIAAHLSRPALLLITDCYSRYWRAVAQTGSSQQHYDVIPADYTLMAVALAAGAHSFRLEYAPPGYTIGRWISLAGLIIYLFAVALTLARSRVRRPRQ